MFLGMKKLLIALLGINALLIALLTAQTTQAAWTKSEKSRVTELEKRVQQLEQLIEANSGQSVNSVTKTYDEVKLAEYSACLISYSTGGSTYVDWRSKTVLSFCAIYKP